MTGQPKKKLKEVEGLADNCFTVALNACAIIPKHYLDRVRQHDPRDQIGVKYKAAYQWTLMLRIITEELDNLLRAKAGIEPRPSRFDEARERCEADQGDLEQQFEQESEQLRGGDIASSTSLCSVHARTRALGKRLWHSGSGIARFRPA